MRDRLDIIHFNMVQRCTNPNSTYFPRYGGRGITVCPEWRTRRNFKKWALSHGYRSDLTIDRIDNDKGYSPEIVAGSLRVKIAITVQPRIL